jgi:hypothetical protein
MRGRYQPSSQTDPDKEVAEARFDRKTGSLLSMTTSISIRNPNSCVGKTQKFLLSHEFQISVVVLVVIDCLCVAGELIIESIQNAIEKHHAIHGRKSHSSSLTSNKTESILNHTSGFVGHEETVISPGGHHIHHDNMHPVLFVLEEIFKYASFVILCVFIVEIILRLIFVPRVFAHILELLDTCVILISFSLNLFLVITERDFYIFTGIITILR